MAKVSIVGEVLQFMWIRKQWWLLPIVLVVVVLGFILVFAQTSSLAPFIYTLI